MGVFDYHCLTFSNVSPRKEFEQFENVKVDDPTDNVQYDRDTRKFCVKYRTKYGDWDDRNLVLEIAEEYNVWGDVHYHMIDEYSENEKNIFLTIKMNTPVPDEVHLVPVPDGESS